MRKNILGYDRKKLYKEVWKEPMTKVAERYGISNVYLKKICVKLGVPTPTNGHWTIVRSGGQVSIPPLPKYEGPRQKPIKEIHFGISINTPDKYSEESKLEKLKQEALDWQTAALIRDYIKAVELKVKNARLSISQKVNIRREIKWAKKMADWLDPITTFRDPIMGNCRYKKLFSDEENPEYPKF